MAVPYASASRARRRRGAGVPSAVPSPGFPFCGRGGGVLTAARDAVAFPSFDASLFAATRAIRISTQVKVEKKDEGIEAMRKLMGGAADEDEEEAG